MTVTPKVPLIFGLCFGFFSLYFPIVTHAAQTTTPVRVGASVAFSKTLNATLLRSPDLMDLPKVQIENVSGRPIKITIASQLETPQGTLTRERVASYLLAAHQTQTIPMYADGPDKLSDEIDLARISVSVADQTGSQEFSVVCGAPKPVARTTADLFGMNVRLEAMTDEQAWRALRRLKELGVTSTRVEFGFPASDGYPDALAKNDGVVLASEAFGIECLGCLNGYPDALNASPEKQRMAHDWAAAIAKHYTGRVSSWQYGDETNAGRGAYGDAADMTALNNAFALGTLSVDPTARIGTLGIAEGEIGFTRAMLENGVGNFSNALCIHPYGGTAESSIGQCLKVWITAAGYGGPREVWADAVGFKTGYTPDQQADQLVRLYTLAKAFGIGRVYWDDFASLIDAKSQPMPAYVSLANLNKAIKDAMPLFGTDPNELVQRHFFRHPDGSVFLIAWALRDGVQTNLHLPQTVTAKDFLGNPVTLASAGDQTLGSRPICIEGLTAQQMPFFIDRSVQVSALDSRTLQEPEHRWRVDPGDTFDVPCVVYNTSPVSVHAQPVVIRTQPGWTIQSPAAFDVPSGQTITQNFKITAPANAVPGVEYQFRFAAELDGLKRSLPYTIRVKTKGDFPYDSILADTGKPSYPMWDSFHEPGAGTGAPNLNAAFGSATVDGDLSDWSASEFHPIDQQFNGILRNPEQPDQRNWTGRVALRWDNQNLYAAFVVLDDDLSLVDFTSRDWRDNDYVRLFLSTVSDPSKRTKNISENDYSLFMAPTGIAHTEPPVVFAGPMGSKLASHVKIASRAWSGGYVIEAAIPFSAMNMTPTPGGIMGLNVIGQDADLGHRQMDAMTYYKNADFGSSPQSLGNLTLLPAK